MEAMAMAMLLPKGLVETTSEVYKEVASYPVVPPEKLWQYWNVYTTTSRKLGDPTAHRLEHFWWHVWGSDRRFLSGPTLARLFEEISHSPTFVPLRPTRNRYEGPSDSRSNTRKHDRQDPKAASPQGQSNQRSDQQRSAPVGGRKLPTPSSSRPPPAHPILKKAGGPSGSRLRPTARFVDPSAFEVVVIPPSTEPNPPQLPSSPQGRHDNAAAAAGEIPPPTKSIPSAVDMPPPPKPSPRSAEMPPPPKPLPKQNSTPSSMALASGTEVRPPAISPAKSERAAPPTGRRVVASTTKRRPVMSRRRSSGGMGTRLVSPATAALVKQVVVQKSKGQAGTGNRDSAIISSSTESQGASASISAKSAGKRPAKESKDQRATASQSVWPPHNQADRLPPPAEVNPPPQIFVPFQDQRATASQSVQPPHNQADGQHHRPPLPAEVKPPPQMSAPFQDQRATALQSVQPLYNQADGEYYRTFLPPEIRLPPEIPAAFQQQTTWDINTSIPGGLVHDRAPRFCLSAQRSAPMVAGSVNTTNTSPVRGSGTATPPKLVRVPSNNTDNRLSLVAMPTGITSVVGTTKTTARGQFDTETVTSAPVVPEARDVPDSVMAKSWISNPVLAPRFTPTPPNPAPPVRFGGSRSHLFLILEKDKGRIWYDMTN